MDNNKFAIQRNNRIFCSSLSEFIHREPGINKGNSCLNLDGFNLGVPTKTCRWNRNRITGTKDSYAKL
jgi:hypothetical protein